MRFTWDPDKAKSNKKKHGVSFNEAVTTFADPLALVIEDTKHGDARYVIIGLSALERILFTVHADIDEETTCIISARCATSHERRRYEESN